MAKVFSPNKDYTGVSATVEFTRGVGECADPYLLSWFEEHGYRVELDAAELKLPVPEPIEEPESGESVNIDEMTVNQLKAYAAERGIELGKAKTKADILAAIEAADPEEPEGGNE